MARFAWHFGNTTVRNPFRLRDALGALKGSPLLGNLQGVESENAFALLLYSKGVVKAASGTTFESNPQGADSVPLLGRKWRSALTKLGFISSGESSEPYQFTPNGQRLLEAGTIAGQQECYLRSLLAYRIPSPQERENRQAMCGQFSPLQFVIQILKTLAVQPDDGVLSFVEMAAIIQTRNPDDGVDATVEEIRELRTARINCKDGSKKFDNSAIQEAATKLSKPLKADSLRDYADTNFRYLKATGLFVSKGRGIAVDPRQLKQAYIIADLPFKPLSNAEYSQTLEKGATLPTDDKEQALIVVDDLAIQLAQRDPQHTIKSTAGLDVKELNQLMHEYQKALRELDELDFARRQSSCVAEIVAYLKMLSSGKADASLSEEVRIARDERPAYLEWAVWRAFLAVNSLKNMPWESRRFQVDNDLKPISCAPGRGPDMVFEFDRHTIVVEVTLTDNSRQEAVEGEPVRRHVAVIAEGSSKKTYGLFIAGNIDTNTAHTFKAGDWYRRDNSKVNLHIVPLRIEDFADILEAGVGGPTSFSSRLENFLIRCRSEANQDARLGRRLLHS